MSEQARRRQAVPSRHLSSLLHIAAIAVLALAPAAAGQLQPATPVGAQPLRVLAITSGPAGAEENGVLRLTEERSIFSRTEDRQVIVFFQWESVPGPHTLTALWRSPDGAQSSASTFEYLAREPRFGAHWSLTLSPFMGLGTWSVEATVDGQPAGRYSFEVRDEKVIAAPIKRPLAAAELYEQLNRMFVVLQRTTTPGQPLEPAGGIVIAPGRIATATSALDGADVVQAAFGNAGPQVIAAVIAFNRIEDWAVLDLPIGDAGQPPVASVERIAVGARCFSMEGSASGSRVLVEGQITGESRAGGYSQPIVTFHSGNGAIGAPVLTEFGELIGLIGGPGIAGASRTHELLRFRAEMRGTLIVPASRIRIRDAGASLTIAQLRKDGQIVAPVVGDLHIESGGFARQFQERNRVQPADQRREFSPADKNFMAFVNWNPQERLRGMMFLRVFDSYNRLVAESPAKRHDLRRERPMISSWSMHIPPNPGRYRVDVLIDDRTMWRDFVTITP
jgi:hypothetical protein